RVHGVSTAGREPKARDVTRVAPAVNGGFGRGMAAGGPDAPPELVLAIGWRGGRKRLGSHFPWPNRFPPPHPCTCPMGSRLFRWMSTRHGGISRFSTCGSARSP